jgi:hypothetical protein
MKLLDRLFSKQTQEIETMHAEVAVGDIFKGWIQSDIGRYVVGRAEQYELSALRRLRDIDPNDKVAIARLQADAAMPGRFLQWIEEAINQGEVAKFQLEEMDGYDKA